MMSSNSVRGNHVNENPEVVLCNLSTAQAKNMYTTLWMARWKQARVTSSTLELRDDTAVPVENGRAYADSHRYLIAHKYRETREAEDLDRSMFLRNPSENKDAWFYLQSNPDTEAAGHEKAKARLKDSYDLVPRADPCDVRVLHAYPVSADMDEEGSVGWRSFRTHIKIFGCCAAGFESDSRFQLHSATRATKQLVRSLKTTEALQRHHNITSSNSHSEVCGFDFIRPLITEPFVCNREEADPLLSGNEISAEIHSAFRYSQMKKDRLKVLRIPDSSLHRIHGSSLHEVAGDRLKVKYPELQQESSPKTDTLYINSRSSPKSAAGVESLFSQKDFLFLPKSASASSIKQIIIKNTIRSISVMNAGQNTFAERNVYINNGELSTSKTESMYGRNASSFMDTTEEFFCNTTEKPEGVEPSNHWRFKRPRGYMFLYLSSLAKRFKVEGLSCKGQLRFPELHQPTKSKQSIELLEIEEYSGEVELKKALSTWIRRWCRSCSQVSTSESVPGKKGNGEVLHEKYKGKLPSIATMAMMGKVFRSYQPYELQKKGKSVVWNAKELIQI